MGVLELRGFIEHYEFPCVGSWHRFHVNVSSKLKQFYSFKKRYTMSNLDWLETSKNSQRSNWSSRKHTRFSFLLATFSKEVSFTNDII